MAGGGKIDLAKAAAAGALKEKGVQDPNAPATRPNRHRHTQSLNFPLSNPDDPATPPASPPVFNFSSLTSPTAFTSAVSPDPTMPNFSNNPLYHFLVQENMKLAAMINSLPPVPPKQHYAVQHVEEPEAQVTNSRPAHLQHGHRRSASAAQGSGDSLGSLPSLDQIRAHVAKKETPVAQVNFSVSISTPEEEAGPATPRESKMPEFLKRRSRDRSASGEAALERENPAKSPKVGEAELQPSPRALTFQASDGNRSMATKRMLNTLSGRRNRFSMIEGITC